MGIYWVTGGILLAYLVLAWFLGSWLHLHGFRPVDPAGRACVDRLGRRRYFPLVSPQEQGCPSGRGGEPADSSGTADIDLLVHEALRRLKSSTLGRGATLRKLPLVFLVGDSGSTKTTTILHSALRARTSCRTRVPGQQRLADASSEHLVHAAGHLR